MALIVIHAMQASRLVPLRHTMRVMATNQASISPQVHAASDMLLPPIPLYRAVLRAHRRLPHEMRSLGDDYVKAEFRRHQKIENPLHIVGFCSQWKMYLDAITRDAQQNEGLARGQSLDPDLLDRFSDEQLYQLYELKLATTNLFDPTNAHSSSPNDASSTSS